jgi:hypothetical protein
MHTLGITIDGKLVYTFYGGKETSSIVHKVDDMIFDGKLISFTIFVDINDSLLPTLPRVKKREKVTRFDLMDLSNE